MPEDSVTRPNPFQQFRDIGHIPLALIALFLLLGFILFILRFKERDQRYQHALVILAGVVFLANQVIIASHARLLLNVQSYAGVDPFQLVADHALIETQKLAYNTVAAFILALAGLALFLPRKDPPTSDSTLDPPADHL